MKLNAEIALAHKLADAAREAIRPWFRSGVAVEQKDDASPVTLADREAEQAMRRIASVTPSGPASASRRLLITRAFVPPGPRSRRV